MERHYGSVGVPTVECINPRLGKWRVRWNIRPETEEGREGCVSFVETEFHSKPSMEAVMKAVLDGMTDASMEELRDMGGLLGENPDGAMRSMLEARIEAYDKSEGVNGFTLTGKQLWLDKSTRVGLANSINIEKAAGKETTSLWFDAVQYEIPVDTALQMLAALELYALACYNVTQSHIATVKLLDDIETLAGYDYTTGYPEKLTFNLNANES